MTDVPAPPTSTPRSPLQGGFFRYPWAATFLLAWTVGVIDGSTYQRFDVFTSNQAGNLVLLGTSLVTDPGAAVLPAASLVGAVAGVILGTWLGLRFGDDDPLRALTPLIAATVALTGTVALDLAHAPLLLIIVAVSGSLGCLAAALILIPAIGVWITANTGQLLTTAAGIVGPRDADHRLPFSVRRAAILTLGFMLGAACSGVPVITDHALLFGIVPTFIALGMGFREYWTRNRDD